MYISVIQGHGNNNFTATTVMEVSSPNFPSFAEQGKKSGFTHS